MSNNPFSFNMECNFCFSLSPVSISSIIIKTFFESLIFLEKFCNFP